MKALFVGLGSIGQRHLRNLKKIRPDVELMAIRSKNSGPVLSDSNQVIRDISKQKYYGLSEFDLLEDALTCKPDIVFITNPTSMHLSVAEEALKSGAFVFIEKPISHNYDGVE